MKRLKTLAAQILVVFSATTFSACAEVYKKPAPEVKPVPEDKFVYTIQFNAKSGKIELLNKERELIKPQRTNFPKEPIPVKAIINVHTIIEAQGSCLVIVDGVVYNVCFR
jgi:hypothetical protein